MPNQYRRWWEQPDTATPTDPGIPQPEPLPWWESEDIAESFPLPVTEQIPQPALGEPEPAGGPVSTPPQGPVPGEGVYVPGVSERLSGGQIQPPPTPTPSPVQPEPLAPPPPLTAFGEPEPVPARTPGAIQPPPLPTSTMVSPEQGEPEPIPPEMDRPGMREGAIYVPGVSEKLWLRRVQDPDVRSQLEALILTAPPPIPQHHRDPTTADILGARAYSESQLTPTLIGAMFLMAQVSTGAKDAVIEQLKNPSGHGQLGELFWDFWSSPAPESGIVKGIEAIGDEMERTRSRYFDQFSEIDKAWQEVSEPLAGLATLSLYYNQNDRDIGKLPQKVLEALSQLGPDASPLEALWHAGQLVYDNAPMPLATGAFQESINPLNFVNIIGGVGVGLGGLAKTPKLLTLDGIKEGIGVIAQAATQLRPAVRDLLKAEAGELRLPDAAKTVREYWDESADAQKRELLGIPSEGPIPHWDSLPPTDRSILEESIRGELGLPNTPYSFDPTRARGLLKVLSDDHLKGEAQYLPKQYAGEGLPTREDHLTLSVNPAHPQARVGHTLYDVEVDIQNPVVFRSYDDFFSFRPPEGAPTIDPYDFLRSAGYDSVYIPPAEGQDGWLVLLDPKKATFHNARDITEELLSRNQTRAVTIREKRDLIRNEADAPIDDEAGRGLTTTDGGGLTADGEFVGGGRGGGGGGGSGYRALPGQGGGGDDFSNITTVFGKPNKPFDPKSWYDNTTRAIQEALTDAMAGANGLVKRWEDAHPGQTIPLRMYTEALISAVYGAPEAGLSRVKGLTTSLDRIMGGKHGWKGNREHLTTYLHLKNALDIWKYLPDHQVSGNIAGPEQAQALLNLLRQNIGEDNWAKLEDGARLIIRTQDQLLQRMVDDGIVDKKVARDVRLRLPHYAPTVIVQEHEAMSGVKGARNWVRKYTELGTTAPRYDPIDSVIQALMMGESRIAQNKARRAMALVAEDLGMGVHVKRPAVPAARLTAREGEEGKVIFRPSPTRFDIKAGSGWTYFDGGKAKTLEIDPEYRWLADEVEYLAGTNDLHNPLNMVRVANEVFRQGLTTYSPAWWFTNFTRDFYTTFITNRVSPVESAKSLLAAVNHVFGDGDALLTDLERRGIGMTGFHGRNPDEVARLAERHGAIVLRDLDEYIKLRVSGSIWDKVVGVGRLEWDGLMQTHDLISGIGRSIELANRRATAATLMKRRGIVPMEMADKQVQYLAQAGVDLEKTLAELTMLTRRSTIDFRRGGHLTRALSSVFLFLNAGTQGMLIPGRNIKDAIEKKDYGKLAWMAGSLTASVAASQVWNAEMAKHLGQQYGMTAEDYLSEVPPDVKAGALWFLLPPDQFDPISGRPKPRFFTLVPRLSEWAQFLGTANYITDRIAGRDREGFGTLFKNIFGQTFPIDSPFELFPTQVGKLGMEIANNRDYFRDRPIIPEELLHRPKTEQLDEYTPQLMIDFAKAHDLSPLMVWHVVSSLGSGARSLVRLFDYANGGRKIDPRIQELANNLIALGPTREARNTFLSNLTREDREAVLDAERVTRRPPTVPVVGDIVGSFLRTRTGGRRVIGRERAEKATGLSADQTDEVGRELAQFAALQDDERLKEDKAMAAGALTWQDWFNREQQRGFSMREQVDRLGLRFPKAAQVQKDPQAYKAWAAAMATLSGTATDQRTLGQLLNIEWRTIPITYKAAYTEDGDKVEGQPDFETYFTWRKEFLDHLTPLERDAFDSERLSHMTPREREWEAASKRLEDYFAIKSDVAGRHPEWRGREYAVSNAITGSKIYKDITDNEEYKEWQRLTSKEKTLYRLSHPDIDNLLVQYGFATKTVQDQIRERAVAMDERIIKQEKVVVERTNNYRSEGTATAARSLLTAQNNLEALRDEKDALLNQIDNPETAREIKPPKPPRPNQPPSESLVKYQIAVSKYKAPYKQDPWIDSQVDKYLELLNNLTFDRSKGTILRWAELSAEDRRKIEAEANTKFRWKPLLKKPTPPLPRPKREPSLIGAGGV